MQKIKPRHEQLTDLRLGRYDAIANQLKRGASPTGAKGYEKALSRLGMTLISEQSPELIPYLLGFQLLDKSDEGDFAAGFFVFDLGGVIVDAPVFLIKGKLKGHQMLFLRNQGLFMPAEPEVITYILNKQDENLGEPMFGPSENRPNRSSINFDVYSSQNRYLQKQASYPSHFDSWSRTSGVLESFVSVLKSDEAAAIKQAAIDTKALPAPDWSQLLEDRRAADALWYWTQQSPAFSKKFASVAGMDWAKKVAEYYKHRDEDIAKKAEMVEFGGLDLSPQYEQPKLAAFTTLAGMSSNVDRQPMVDELLRYGACFFDERGESQTKTAMLIQENDVVWASPLESGRYEVPLLSGGEADVLVVVPKDVIGLGGYDKAAIVIDPSGKSIGAMRVAELPTRTVTNRSLEEADSFLSAGAVEFNPGSVGEDDVIVLMDAAGKMTSPFCILPGGSKETGYEICRRHLDFQGRRRGMDDTLGDGPSSSRSVDVAMLRLDDDAKKLAVRDLGDYEGLLVVPPDAKMIKIKTDDDCCMAELSLMPLSQMGLEDLRKQASFTIRRLTKGYVEINSKTYADRKAAMFLMTSGVSKEAALKTIDDAVGLKQAYAVVPHGTELWKLAGQTKIALTPLQMDGDSDYAFADPSPAARGQTTGQYTMPEETGVSEQIRSTGMQFADTAAPPWSSENTPHPDPTEFGGSGMAPEDEGDDPSAVFQNSVFLTLIGDVNTSTDRERLLSSLMKCCDDAGRTLFLIYAHGEEYAEAYGVGDAKELEEQLLRTFEAAGQLIVRLLNRSIGPTSDLDLATFADS